MARICSACRHEHVESINLELFDKTPLRKVSEKYGLSLSAVARHAKHLPPELFQPAEVRRATAAIERIGVLDQRVDEIYQAATAGNDPKLALRALKELRGIIELYSRLTGELQNAGTVNNTLVLAQAPEWLSTRALLLDALQPYPQAREAVIKALGAAGNV